jgi:hypothetical protein
LVAVRRFSDRTHAFQLRERFHGAFLRGQFHGLAILGFALPPDGVNWPDLKSECRPKSAAHRHAPPKRAGRCRRTAQCGIFRQVKQPLHVVHPHRPGFIQHHQLTFGQPVSSAAGFAASSPRIPLCAKHPLPPPSARRTAVQSSPLCRRRPARATPWFCRAGQTAQAGDAVTGAQDMVNRPALIFAQPVGRPVAGMQRRDGIAARVDRLNQIQFRCQNLWRGKSAFGFHQVRRILHRRFQMVQIHFTQDAATTPRPTVHAPARPTCARRHGRRHGSGLGFPVQRRMPDGLNEPTRGVFAAIAVHRLTIAPTAVRALRRSRCL